MKDEIVIASGLQQRLFALFSRRMLVAITNSRLIEIRRSLLGGFRMEDYQRKDLRDASISENIIPNIFGAKLDLIVRSGSGNIAIDGLPSAVASTVYSHAHAQEWEEKNRIRDLEEKRAMSGASVVNGDAEYQELKSKIISKAA